MFRSVITTPAVDQSDLMDPPSPNMLRLCLGLAQPARDVNAPAGRSDAGARLDAIEGRFCRTEITRVELETTQVSDNREVAKAAPSKVRPTGRRASLRSSLGADKFKS
jgi:hypothetical protein